MQPICRTDSVRTVLVHEDNDDDDDDDDSLSAN